jgi:hypothetical protein
MSDLWSFLSQPDNQATLSWLGGGLVILCGGLWAVLKFYLGQRRGGAGSSGGGSEASPVSASRGGTAAGRDIRIDNRRGLPPGHLVLLLLAFLGALLFAIGFAGNKVTVTNGVGVGGNVEGSTITNQ